MSTEAGLVPEVRIPTMRPNAPGRHMRGEAGGYAAAASTSGDGVPSACFGSTRTDE